MSVGKIRLLVSFFCKIPCFESKIKYRTYLVDLSEPVDVYSAWIDACEEVNRQKRLQAQKAKERASRDDSRSPPPQSYTSRDRLNPYDQDEDDEDEEDDDY